MADLAPQTSARSAATIACARAAGGPRAGRADILAVGFGTTAAMWAVGFFCRLPGTPVPSWLLFVLLLGCLLTGGFLIGRLGQRGVRGGVYAGLVTGVLNLLILGSVLGDKRPNTVVPSALLWIPGSLLASMAVTATGTALGGHWRRTTAPPNWRAAFCLVAAGATLLLLAVGGSVTGYDYGLAVVDWPNTQGYNMFLYPLARMTGGIYFEHAHRLIGALVGLTTLVLTVYLQLAEQRRWVKGLAWIALALVVTQGMLGGLRVTGRFTLSTLPEETAPNIALAIFHGILGQLFFALLMALAVFQLRAWTGRDEAIATPAARTERALSTVLGLILAGQLVLGALVRHLTPALYRFRYGLSVPAEELIERGTWALHVHITVAVLILMLGLATGLRHWGLSRSGMLPCSGVLLMVLLSVQVILGVIALLVTGNDAVDRPPTGLEVLVTTSHQLVGALLLALAVWMALWDYRLLMRPRAWAVPKEPLGCARGQLRD